MSSYDRASASSYDRSLDSIITEPPEEYTDDTDDDLQKPTTKNKYKTCFKDNCLTFALIAAVSSGLVTGIILKSTREWSQREVMYVGYIGNIFLRSLKALILPLIVTAVVSAISKLDFSLSRAIAFRTLTFQLATTVFAAFLGVLLAVIVRPGSYHPEEDETEPRQSDITTADTLLDLIRNLFPPNLIQAAVEESRTNLIINETEPDPSKWKIGDEVYVNGTNILGMVMFSAVLAVSIAKIGKEAKPLADFLAAFFYIITKLTHWVILLSPIAVFSLITAKILEMGDLAADFSRLGKYFAVVLVGLIIHGFVVMPALFYYYTKKSPVRYFLNLKQALVIAFGTASSSATMPTAIECLEYNNEVDPRVVRFAIPVGTVLNYDGTALYEAVAAVYIAQYLDKSLVMGDLLTIILAASIASMAVAGIPQAGLVTMVMVLDCIGITAENVVLVKAVDWLLDRFRTAVNVMGNCFVAGIVDHRSQDDLHNPNK